MKLDRIDIRVLHELQKNGRITNVELADLVHLSPSPCLMRVKKLQKEGYITGYSAEIDIAKLSPTQLNSGLFEVFSKGRTITTSVALVCADAPKAAKSVMIAVKSIFLKFIRPCFSDPSERARKYDADNCKSVSPQNIV